MHGGSFGKKTGYKVVCGGDSLGVLLNGSDGKNGAAGKSAYELSGTDKSLEEWLASLKGENGKSCSVKQVENGVELTCPGAEPVTIKNGTVGAAGKSCTTKEVSDGIELTCPNSDPVVIKNGTPGANGKSCTVVENDAKNGYDVKCYNDEKGEYEIVGQLKNGEKGENGKSATDGWLVDHRNYHVYKTVTIGNQVWMAENLDYNLDNYGSFVAGETASERAEFLIKYGRLYTWATAVGWEEIECGFRKDCDLDDGYIQGVCPDGWHLPSSQEWKDLIVSLDENITEYENENVAGKALKSKTGWAEFSGIVNDDAYSFAVLPAGYRSFESKFDKQDYNAYFWSSTQCGEDYGCSVYFSYNNDNASSYFHVKDYAFSVRCVKDE